MWSKRAKTIITTLTLLTIGVLSLPAAAVLPDSELGLWFKSEATPQLLEVIGKHPRFKGERVSVVAMQGRKPLAQGHHLGQRLEEYVTHRLLSQSQASITWRDQDNDCRPVRPTPYLLGIEVNSLSRQRAVVTIAVVDVEENVWVPGTSLQWQGRLSTSERRALQQPVSRPADGSAARPIPFVNHKQLEQRLLSQLHCTMPAGIDGALHLAVAKNSPANLVELNDRLKQSLRRSPLFDLAQDSDSASWLALLQVTGSSNPQLELLLTEVDGSGKQRLAAVHIDLAGATTANVSADSRHNATGMQPANNPGALPLLSEIEEIDIAPCPKNSTRQCLQVELALEQPAWLMTFRTQSGSVTGQSCSGSVKRSDPATKRYRVTLDEHGDVGFYAMATADPQVAKKLARLLARAPGNCNRSGTDITGWLTRLNRLINQHEHQIHWRATHLSSESALAVAER